MAHKLNPLACAFLMSAGAGWAQPFTGDLRLSIPTLAPSPARSGEMVAVDFLVDNLGPGAGQLASYEIYVRGERRQFSNAFRTFAAVGEAVSFSDSVPMPIVSASTQIDVEVRIVDNQNTANNIQRVMITVLPADEPDIAVDTPAGWGGPLIVADTQGATQSMRVISGGRPLYVNFGYQNLGAAFASPTVRALVLLDGVPMFDAFYPAMSAGERRRVANVMLDAPGPGSHTLEIVYDDGNTIDESDEGNNRASTTFRVDDAVRSNLEFSVAPGSQWPQAVILSASAGTQIPQTDFSLGDSVFADLSIRNTGTEASTDFDVNVLLDGAQVGSFRQTAIPAGGEALILDRPEFTNLQAGGTLTYVLDANNESDELDEEDNRFDIAFTVGGAGECPADVNGDGFVDFFDYSDYVAAFEAGGAGADFNRDGFVDLFDYADFVQAFESGAC